MTSHYIGQHGPHKAGSAPPVPHPATRRVLAALAAVIPDGRGWTACCPCHEDTEFSLLIAEEPQGMPVVHCLAGCSRESLLAHFRSAGALPASSNAEPSQEEDIRRILIQSRPVWTAEARAAIRALRACGLATDRLPRLLFHRALKRPPCKEAPALPALVLPLWSVGRQIKALHCLFIGGAGAGSERFADAFTWGFRPGLAVHLDRLQANECTLALCQDVMTGLAIRQATRLPVWTALSARHLLGIKLPGSVWQVHLFASWDRFGQSFQIVREAAECLSSEGRRVFLHLPSAPSGGRHGRTHLDALNEEGNEPLRQAVETASPYQSDWERSWRPPKALRDASHAPQAAQVRRVLGWICRARRRRFSRRQALRALPSAFPNARSLTPVLNVLAACEFIRPLANPKPKSGPGRPPGPLYEVNPWVFGHGGHRPRQDGGTDDR